jgi:hypothetical protein
VMNRLRLGAGRCKENTERGRSYKADWMCHQRSPFTRPIVHRTSSLMRRCAKKVNEPLV